MIDSIQAAADDVYPDVVALRRTLHRHPELSGKEIGRASCRERVCLYV